MAPLASMTACSVTLLLMMDSAFAHSPYWEKQAFRRANFDSKSWAAPTADEDLSISYPFDILKQTALPGPSVRETLAIVVTTVLFGSDDVDFFLYNKTSEVEIPFIGYPILPACKEYTDFYPTVALLGPAATVDSRTGKAIFTEPIPALVQSQLPSSFPTNYKAKIVQQRMVDGQPRTVFAEPMAHNSYLLPSNFPEKCIEGWQDPANQCDLSNVLTAYINTPGAYYWVTYHSTPPTKMMSEIAFVAGAQDNFTPIDFARFFAVADFLSHGRWLNDECTPYES